MQRSERSDTGFVILTGVLIVVTHAVAFFVHEYAHSVLAWALGFMSDPLALDYGSATPGNLLFQVDVGDNVQYEPILAGGHGLAAAAIALAGAFVGNGLLYVAVYAAARGRARELSVPLAATLFWLMLMCAANVWSYVPLRAITSHADIATAASGLGVSPLVLFPFVLVPALAIVGHFFARTCRLFVPVIAQGSTARAAVLVALVGAWFFLFFGSVGFFGNYGAVSQAMSIASAVLLLPLSVLWLWRRCT